MDQVPKADLLRLIQKLQQQLQSARTKKKGKYIQLKVGHKGKVALSV
jgi:hypothetical protein